jgi:hypothetical protein
MYAMQVTLALQVSLQVSISPKSNLNSILTGDK